MEFDPDALNYKAAPTMADFHKDPSFVRGVMGPLGCGKTVACAMEALLVAQRQEPNHKGIRRTRGAIVRNTYPKLKSTTIKTWQEWMSADRFGSMVKYDIPMTHHIRRGDIDMEVFFIALDRPDDVDKLKSLELTWCWINEATEMVTDDVFQMATARVGRFPHAFDGGPTWSGVWLDYNAPDSDHWLYKLFEENQPEGYTLYKQPPAILPHREGNIRSVQGTRYKVSPQAENLQFVGGMGADKGTRYYTQLSQGKDDAWIKVFLMNEYGFTKFGQSVFTAYVDGVHHTEIELKANSHRPLLLAFDFWLRPACVIAQFSQSGVLQILDEITTESDETMGLERFLDQKVLPHLAMYYPNCKTIKGWGDPSGINRSATDESSCFDLLFRKGFRDIYPAPTNKFQFRREAVEHYLIRMVDGMPGIVFGPRCRRLRAGFLGRYYYGHSHITGETGIMKKEPVKNLYSHPQDALQYLCLGATMETGKGNRIADAITRGNRMNRGY